MRNHLTLLILFISTLGFSQEKYRNFITKTDVSEKGGLALVLANNDYDNIKSLESAIEDGNHMLNTLKKANFDIEVGFNLSKSEMESALDSFASKIPNYKHVVVYYSGHGVQMNGENYIIPKDAKGEKEWQFKATTINLNELFKKMEDSKKPKLVILDACRNNPFENQKSMVIGKGLALVEALSNSITLFATAPNTSIHDSNQFTEILGKEIEKGGCIEDVIKRTGKSIKAKYPNQLIWPQGHLTGEICFGDSTKGTSLDSDGDGVIDDVDKCPNEFGLVQNLGCPKSFDFKLNRNLNEEELIELIKDPENISLIKQEAISDNQFALYNLGSIYLHALGDFDYDYEKAVHYFERSANFGNSWAENNLGYLYECQPSAFKNDELAFEWFKRSAEKNNPSAYFNIAVMYDKGNGTDKDFDRALEWYKKAAHTGISEAQYKLGEYYFEERDWSEAYYWFNEAISDEGLYKYGELNYILGEMFYFGQHVDKNYSTAYRYIKKAADLNHTSSYYMMGVFYENGHVVEKNREVAFDWYNKGADAYDTRACERIGKYCSSSTISSSYTSCNTISN